jgi:hypothetical protein
VTAHPGSRRNGRRTAQKDGDQIRGRNESRPEPGQEIREAGLGAGSLRRRTGSRLRSHDGELGSGIGGGGYRTGEDQTRPVLDPS